MIRASLIAYLRTARLGPFVPSCARDTVLDLLGSPPYWDGWGGIPSEASAIWVYDSIQFNFDERMKLADTHIGFESTYDGTSVKYSDWTNTFLQFDDLDLDTISTPENFRDTMATHQIGMIQHSLSGTVLRLTLTLAFRRVLLRPVRHPKMCAALQPKQHTCIV